MKWLPIETAPKDGSDFLGFDKNETIATMHWLEYPPQFILSGVCWGDESDYAEPTHWMPLPEPPES